MAALAQRPGDARDVRRPPVHRARRDVGERQLDGPVLLLSGPA